MKTDPRLPDGSAIRSLRVGVPADLHAELERLAAAGDRTLAAEARRALRLYTEDARHRDEVTR